MSLIVAFAAAMTLSQGCAPAAQSAWSRPVEQSEPASLRLGAPRPRAVHPVEEVRWTLPPEREPRPGSRGAAVTMQVEREGTYLIALEHAAWIDVAGPAGLVASRAHGHGPAGSGIRKIVEFSLRPGVYSIQLSGAAVPAMRILAARC